MPNESTLWCPMKDDLPVVSIIHKVTASFAPGEDDTLSIRASSRLPEGELLLVAASAPHAHYWCAPLEQSADGTLSVSMKDFSAAAASCADTEWTLSLGRRTEGGVNLYPLEKGGKASYVKKLDVYFCDDRRRYEAPVTEFSLGSRRKTLLPRYTQKQYALSLLVEDFDGRYAHQLACRLTDVTEEDGQLIVTVQCPKTMEQPEGVFFHGEEGQTPVCPGSAEGDFTQSHRLRAALPMSHLDGLTGAALLACAVKTEGGVVLHCPIRFADPEAAARFQSRYELRPARPDRYLSVNGEHQVLLEALPELPGTQHPKAETLEEYLSSNEYRVEGGVTAFSQGGENWQWRLRFPNLDLTGVEECCIVMEKSGSAQRVLCLVKAEREGEGSLITADLSALPDTLENTLYSDWTMALALRKGDAFFCLPVLDPLHTYYDPHDFQTAFNFTSDLNRQPIGTVSLFGRTVEGCPHWVRKHNTRMCLRMADHTLRYMTSFTCRAEWGKLHFGVLTMKLQCPKIDGKWCGFVLSHRAKQEADRRDYEFPLSGIRDCGDHLEATVKIKVKKLDFSPLYWDMRVIFEQNGTRFWCSIKAPMVLTKRSDKLRQKVRSLFFGESVVLNEKYQLFLYRTAYNRFSLVCQERSPYSGFLFRLKERLACVLYFLLRKRLKKQSILLTYEKYCCMAQDNGFYFFQYCMEHDMEKELNRKIYFVIDKKAADYKERLLPYKDHVIQFMSLRHMVYLMGCRLMVSSDSKSHAYAWRCKESIIAPYVERNRRLVFLQHGVIALKKVDFFRSGTNVVDLFVTSNDREHDIIVEELGYQPHEVIITGLTRWDVMEDRSAQQSPKTILSCPHGETGWRRSATRPSVRATTTAAIWTCSTTLGWKPTWKSTICV